VKSLSHNTIHRLLLKLSAKENVSLAPYSTLKIGGPARYFITPRSITEVMEIERACFEHEMPIHVLSGGSNTLFSDEGFLGVVIKLGSAFDFIKPSSDGLSFSVGAATSLAKFSKIAIHEGWMHAVGLCGIPGLVGGAIRMNAGTRHGEIQHVISSISGILGGQSLTLFKKDIEFSYRKISLPSNFIIHSAEFKYDKNLLKPADELIVLVDEYRKKRKATQPSVNSLGSFFINPYPSFAGQLIEQCNLKGLRHNNAQISPLHANFIVNNGGASAQDILQIASIAQRSVFDKFGVLLNPEIRLVGRFESDMLSRQKEDFI
jgi:UDP-N-acetylmuramate dehydrogenase